MHTLSLLLDWISSGGLGVEILVVSPRGLGLLPQGDLSQGLVGAPCPPHATQPELPQGLAP